MSDFKWTRKRDKAALLLADGYTQGEVATQVGVTRRTIERWCANEVFDCEVDRLTLMTGIAAKAERLKIAKRAIRQSVIEAGVKTKKDILDWVKYAQSETDGIKLDLTSIFEDALAVAGGGSGGDASEDGGAQTESPAALAD